MSQSEMQARVAELKEACRKMQDEVALAGRMAAWSCVASATSFFVSLILVLVKIGGMLVEGGAR